MHSPIFRPALEGLRLPGFKPFTYLTTVRRPHGTGVRRLGESEKAAPVESAATEEALEEADRKWDPENHPSRLVEMIRI